ncbi:hypothetical protein D3C71_2175880 [compost metagenome]
MEDPASEAAFQVPSASAAAPAGFILVTVAVALAVVAENRALIDADMSSPLRSRLSRGALILRDRSNY